MIVLILKFLLWKFSFTARVNGFFSYREIMIRIKLHLCFSVIIRIENISINFSTSKIIRVRLQGFQIFILVKNEFNNWTTKKIEVLQMLEDIRTSLKRKGLLQSLTHLKQKISQSAERADSENTGQDARSASNILGSQKSFIERSLERILTSIEVELINSAINFYVYQDPDKKIDESNVKKFYQSFLNEENFRNQSLCFRIFIPNVMAHVKTMTDEEVDLFLRADQLLLQNPVHRHKQGIFTDVQLLVKIPLDKKLAKDFCNYDIRIIIQRGILNFNKKSFKSMLKFFVVMDTLKNIIKRVKKLILKLHYMDDLLKEMFDNFDMDENEVQFENHRDEDIPKRLGVVIQDGLTLIMSDPDQKLSPFLQDKGCEPRQTEIIYINFSSVAFELLKNLRNSYYITIQSDQISIECNMKKNLIIDNFFMELDFTYKKQISDSPVKESKIQVIINIKSDNVALNLNMAFFKSLVEFASIYKECVWVANVKSKIMGQILDKDFLKSNLLHLGTSLEEQEKEKKILQLFREMKHKDYIDTEIAVGRISGKLFTYEQANQIDIDFSEFRFKFKADKGLEELGIKSDYINLQPVKPKSLSLFKTQNFEYTTISCHGNDNEIIENQQMRFSKCQVNVNMETILNMTQDILNMSFVMKHFSRKWRDKFRIRDVPRKTIVESFTINFQEMQLIWNMSSSRVIAYRIIDFKTKPIQCPFKKDSKIGMSYFCTTFQAYHTKTILEQAISGQLFCEDDEVKKQEFIFNAENLEFKMIGNAIENKIKLNCSKLDFNLPTDLNFGAVIFENLKQVAIARKWFSKEYLIMKRKVGFQYRDSRKRSAQMNQSVLQQEVPVVKGKRKAFRIQIDVQDVIFQADEKAMKEIFVNKNEIVDTLQERGIFKCRPAIILKLLKKLKQSKLNEKAMIIQAKNFKMIYEVPQQLLDFDQVFQVVLNLDEAKEYMTPQHFKGFDPGVHTYTSEYISMHSRNLLKPLIEIWDLDFKFLLINGILNSKQNAALFKTKVVDKIFKKFEVVKSYNKLMSKQFYDADLKCTRMRINFQGQQTLLFFDDFLSIFERFSFEDLSVTKDPRKQKLKYYSGIDMLRNRMHGKLKINVNHLDFIAYPKRKFNRFDTYLLVTFQDFIYNQNLNYQEIWLRNLVVSKQPIQQFESPILKLPLLEFVINIIYNQGKTLNHYSHYGSNNIGQYLDQLKGYSSQETELDCKLNIPSLGSRNESSSKISSNHHILKGYVEESPIPIFHYQRCHARFFDSLYREYILKRDYSGPVKRRRQGGGTHKIKSQRQYLFKIKAKTFLNDLMVLFTDYREDLNDDGHKQKYKKDPNVERDDYLNRYEGLIFSQENLCFKTSLSVKKGKDKNQIELKNSYFQCNFLRLSYLNYNNLFNIRHPCFKRHRQSQYENSFDNYKYFCQFFEIHPQNQQTLGENQYNQILQNFKTILPLYINKNFQLQSQIMVANLNPSSVNPFQNDDFTTYQDDFVFTNTDTIGILLSLGYSQDKEITVTVNQNRQTNDKKAKKHNPLILDKIQSLEFQEKIIVKHLVDIKGIRFLYTKQTKELITHHLIKGFNYSQFRKTDFKDTEVAKDNKKSFLNEYEYSHAGKGKKGGLDHSGGGNSHPKLQDLNLNELRKCAYIAIRLDDPQINFQNEMTKSQMLLGADVPTTAVIFAYSKISPPLLGTQNCFMDDLSRVKSGYNMNYHEEVVKYQMSIHVTEMEVYVAPTSINLENPTFWISHDEAIASPNNSGEQQQNQKQKPPSEKEYPKNDNVLRKIFTMNNIEFTFDFLKEEFVDHLNSKMSIDILIEKLESEMDGPNMWHFVYVLKSILFDRGEKAAESVLIEQKRADELSSMKIDIIKSIIDQKLKKGFLHGSYDFKPSMVKKISYHVLNGEFKLQDFDTMFAQVVISKTRGTHYIYSNRESRIDIDIDRILIENYSDSEDYRMVLYPGYSLSNLEAPQANSDTMIKLRARDKFVVVKEAPWRVFDQFEVFIYPTSIQFTSNFYKHFKSFFFAEQIHSHFDKSLEEEQKYELLVPTKLLKKTQKKTKQSKDSEEFKEYLHKGKGSFDAQFIQFKKYFKKGTESHKDIDNLSEDDISGTVAVPQDTKKVVPQQFQEPPIFFRYMRMNEVGVSITYFHNKNSFLNSKDLKIKMTPFIRHGKFVTFKRIFEKYEGHCKKNFISQIPSLIKQKFLQTRQKLDELKQGNEDLDDDDDDKLEIKKEIKLQNARKILFGDLYEC